MNKKTTLSIAFASLCLSLSGALPASAQSSGPSTTDAAAQSEAQQMVPAQVVLAKDLDAKKVQPGTEFRATLHGKVRLKDGQELPSGSVITGTVATDDLNLNGTAKLALRFTQVQPKNGQALPIKAMIVSIFPPRSDNSYESEDQASAAANSWDPQELQVHAINVAPGIDLNSKIDSGNSGVLVATKKNDVKLPAGEQIDLVIAPQSHGQQTANGGGN